MIRGNIHGVDQRAFRHLLKEEENGLLYTVYYVSGESIRRLLSSRIYSYQFKTLILPGSGNHPIGYEIGSDYTKTYFIHILSYYVLRSQMYDFCLT